MLLSEAISQISYILRGTDDDAPVSGTEEHTYWLSFLNRIKNGYFQDVVQTPSEAYSVESLGTITASATPSYNLDATFIAPSGDGDSSGVYVVTTSDQRINFTLIKPEQRSVERQEVYIAGTNPEKLYFSNEIEATDQIVGGELFVAGYYMPADLADDADVLPFSYPDWAVLATAAEIAYNDIVYEDRADGISARAEEAYRKMTNKKRRGTYGQPRRTPSLVSRIRGY